MRIFVYLLGPNTYVCNCSTLVIGPAIEVTTVMELIENSEPVVQIRVSPVRLDNCISHLIGTWIDIRFIRGHSIDP
jgi:hypothetical protein